MKHQTLSTEKIVNIPEKPFYHWDMKQRTQAWYEARMGKITGSGITRLLGKRGAKKADAETYIFEKVSEIVTGHRTDRDEYLSNFDLERGIKYEDSAREAYSIKTLSEVKECGLIQRGKYVAYSPDGLVGEDGMIEIKNFDSAKYTKYLIHLISRGKEIPYENQVQMQFGLYASERKWHDFVLSNYKHEANQKDLFFLRTYPDDKIQKEIDEVVKSSILSIQNLVNEYNNLLLS